MKGNMLLRNNGVTNNKNKSSGKQKILNMYESNIKCQIHEA